MKNLPISLAFILLLSSCANLISDFDQNSFTAATELKAQSLLVMSEAVEPYDNHKDEAEALLARLNGQLAYEEGKGKANTISAKEWNLIISEEYDLLGKFILNWKNGQKFMTPYIQEKSLQVGEAFDQILKLEGSKAR